MKRFLYCATVIVLLSGCNNSPISDNKNSIIFSCMVCKGCVYDNITYILDNQLDLKYDISIDSTCQAFKEDKFKSLIRQLKYTHMSAIEIEEQFGVFGNFILLDSTSNRIDFMTDMHLRDYIQ